MFEYLTQPLKSGSSWIHFSGYRAAVYDAITRAREDVRITTYVAAFSTARKNNPVTQLMALLKQRRTLGANVRFLVDGPKKNKSNEMAAKVFIHYLHENGFRCAINWGKPTLHMKVIICDRTRLFIGSHNLTRFSIASPLDCSVETSDPNLIAGMIERFDILYGGLENGQG